MNSDPSPVPPYSIEAEKGIIGCVLFDGNRASELNPEWFYVLNHRAMAEGLIDLATSGGPVDAFTLSQRMVFTGSTQLIAECASSVGGSFEWWAEILAGYLTIRKILKLCSKVSTSCYGPLAGEIAGEVLDAFERDVLAIRSDSSVSGCNAADLKIALRDLIKEWEEAAQHGRTRGIHTGYGKMDEILGGIKSQELIVIAARPSVGKTSLAMNFADSIAVDQGIPVGVFSLEMSTNELLARLTCCRSGVDLSVMNSGMGTARELSRITMEMDRIKKAPLHIVDKGGISLQRLLSSARRLVQRHSIKLLIVDYLGLVSSGMRGQSLYEKTSCVSNGLKLMAKELDIPVIALCQLNRASEKDKRAPSLHDLRDSGAIEQDADVVILLHRNGEHQIEKGKGIRVSCVVAKHRNGPTGHLELEFIPQITKFSESTGIPQDAGIKQRKDSYGDER